MGLFIYLFKMKIVHEVHTQSKMIKKKEKKIRKNKNNYFDVIGPQSCRIRFIQEQL